MLAFVTLQMNGIIWTGLNAAEPTPIPETRVNLAETIFVPFWDAARNDLSSWKFENQRCPNATIRQQWDRVAIYWREAPQNGQVAELGREMAIPINGRNEAVAYVDVGPGALVELEYTTDTGIFKSLVEPNSSTAKETQTGLGAAKEIRGVKIRVVHTGKQGAGGAVALMWIMLTNTDLLAAHLQSSQNLPHDWSGFLVREDEQPGTVVPLLGLWGDASDLADARRTWAIEPAASARLLNTERDLAAGKFDNPEKLIREYIGWGSDRRYTRERDIVAGTLLGRTRLAELAAIKNNVQMQRLAARTALSIAATGSWDVGNIAKSSFSSWETRAFVPSDVAAELVYFLDLAGQQFTEAGRNFILRRLAEEAIGTINFNVWRHQYIFSNNQLAIFTYGRVLGYLAMEKYWGHVRPYTELAMAELNESMAEVFRPDGGFVESPGYFQYTLSRALPTYLLYARARKVDPLKMIPQSWRATGDYMEVFLSTTSRDVLVPVGPGFGGAGGGNHEVAYTMSSLNLPAWSLVMKRIDAFGKNSQSLSLQAWLLARREKASMNEQRRAFVQVPSIGSASSVRSWEGGPVKILVIGSPAKSGHTHEDRGSFVWEAGGETFASDGDGFRYDDARNMLIGQCQRHNMVLPVS